MQTGLSRRTFLVASVTATGGMALGFGPPAEGAVIAPEPWATEAGTPEINAWIVIEPDETVTIRVHQSDMGQGVLTAIPMIVAEELGCDWQRVRAEYVSANRHVRENGLYRRLATGGSGAVRRSRELLQQAGTSARARLVEAAARRWDVPAGECDARAGQVIHAASGRSLTFGQLAREAAGITLTAEPAIKTPDRFTLIGRSLPRLDVPVKVTGKAEFGIDVRVPGMVYAAVAACPVFGGKVRAYDERAILGRRGVLAVVPVEGGVAVVADRYWRAQQALKALPITWDYGAGSGSSSEQLAQAYRQALDGPAAVAAEEGDVAAGLQGGRLVEALYEVPHLAHATMEPLNCTARVENGRVDIWMGTQNPEAALRLAARTAGVPPEAVEIHNCYLGGGFGRRSVNDELVQAVTVAKAVGRPVKLIWSREEDMRHDRYRPQAAIRFRAALGADGMPTGWHARTAVGSIMRSLGRDKVESGVERAAVEGLENMPYHVPAKLTECVLKNTHVPVMFWRSVGSSQNAFAVEGFIDELAHAAGEDPYRFRRRLLQHRPDFLHVLDVLAERSGWGRPMPAGKGRGMAIHESFGTIVGEVAEVAVDAEGGLRVERVVAAFDCGHLVNPQTAIMQIESGVIYGLTAALYGEITIRDGRVEQGNFDDYRMVRLADSPRIETYPALTGGKKWGGIGEPGTPPIAPAVCNAIFAATGRRVRRLPIKNEDLASRA